MRYGPLLYSVDLKSMIRVVGCLFLLLMRTDASNLECKTRHLMVQSISEEITSLRPGVIRDVAEALEMERLCGVKLDSNPVITTDLFACGSIYIASDRSHHVGDMNSIEDAVNYLSSSGNTCKDMVLRSGVHYLKKTLILGKENEGLRIIGEDSNTWISGGTVVNSKTNKLVVETFAENVLKLHYEHSNTSKDATNLFMLEPHIRMQRSRWPNSNTEVDQWGYASTLSGKVSVTLDSVEAWLAPPRGDIPTFTFVDLRQPNNPSSFIKNDSAQEEYNMYSSGHDGVCSDMWDTSYSSSYWCGNASSGGWAEVDNEFAKSGRLGIPVGLTYKVDSLFADRAKHWNNATSAVIHAWHSQSWFTNMFEVKRHTNSTLFFGRGGSQGGRSWCRCDQCSYAAKDWCKNNTDPKALISGTFYVENVLEELDSPQEFYSSAGSLEILLNATYDPYNISFIVPRLSTLIEIRGTTNIVISKVGFRDTKQTYLDKYGVPSGGDWALNKQAAIVIEDSSFITVKHSQFKRLDSNGILLMKRCRNVTLKGNEFSWIGESAMAAWGETNEWDGQAGNQPRGTVVKHNIVREIGIYEKQSSAWFQAKSCQTTITGNLFFNMPRAAINFNDGFGGGNIVSNNFIFNTCRESGDHGAINSWDRQPFIWDSILGFNPQPTFITNNFIFAGYGASQGVDNDDGSSFYHIINNVFYDADGFKMDYGGHDSLFADNLIITRPYDGQNCVNMAAFYPKHQHRYMFNTCIMPVSVRQKVGHLSYCNGNNQKPGILRNNSYFSKGANASFECNGQLDTLLQVQEKFHLESGSMSNELPSDDIIFDWIHSKVQSFHQQPTKRMEIM